MMSALPFHRHPCLTIIWVLNVGDSNRQIHIIRKYDLASRMRCAEEGPMLSYIPMPETNCRRPREILHRLPRGKDRLLSALYHTSLSVLEIPHPASEIPPRSHQAFLHTLAFAYRRWIIARRMWFTTKSRVSANDSSRSHQVTYPSASSTPASFNLS